jgi:hypothetical protein
VEPAGPELSLYPNPAGSVVNILVSTDFAEEKLTLEILDIRGAVLRGSTVWSGTPQAIDLSDLPAGLYLVKVNGEGFVRMGKMVRR